MEVYTARVVIIVLLLPPVFAAEQDPFAEAYDAINLGDKFDYKTLCLQIVSSGKDKIACRIKKFPSVGFLFCKTPIYAEGEDKTDCKEVIENEVNLIRSLKTDNVKTVKVHDAIIHGVPCWDDSGPKCSGYLEEWIDQGLFQHIRDGIVKNKVSEIIQNVITKCTTDNCNLITTVADLSNILTYMNPAVLAGEQKKFKQICDLQGFFLKEGGFLVIDVPFLLGESEDIGKCCYGNDPCHTENGNDDYDPTTGQVLQALDQMINEFSQFQPKKILMKLKNSTHPIHLNKP